MNKKTFVIIGLFVGLALIVGFGINSQVNKPSNIGADGREIEGGGPAAATLSNTGKLNSLLTPSRFAATKDGLSKYILAKYPTSKTAIIEKTILDKDDSISLTIKLDDGSTIDAKVQSLPDSLVVEVSASGYKKTYTEEEIFSIYGGAED